MACFKRPVITSLKGRNYATRAAQNIVNEAESQVTRVSIVYNAGSKYETSNNRGITHAARYAMCAGNPNRITGVELPKLVQHIGGSLNCTSTREHLIFTFEGQEKNLGPGVAALLSAATPANFTDSIDLDFLVPQINLELSRLELAPKVQALELIHKAAFGRSGLANSLYMPRYAVGSHSMDMINQYLSQFYNPANGTLFTTGVDGNDAAKIAESFASISEPGEKYSLASNYMAEEAFQEAFGNDATFALAFEGVSLNGPNAAALNVLKHIIGNSESRVKYADGKAGSAIASNSPVNVDAMCFNYSYSDTGLFGVVVSADGNEAGKAVDSTVATLAKIKGGSGITEQDLKTAKAKAAVENASSYEDLHGVCVSRMSADSEGILKAEAIAVENVTLNQVKEVAKKLLSSPPSFAAVGNLQKMPFLRDIKL